MVRIILIKRVSRSKRNIPRIYARMLNAKVSRLSFLSRCMSHEILLPHNEIMHESILIVLVKKYLWQLIATAICLSMVHQALENWWWTSKWVKIAKGIVNAIYASVFFGWIIGYYFDEVWIVGWILVGGLVWLSTAKEFAIGALTKFWKDKV